MNKIIISLVMLLASISFSQVNTVYHDGIDCNCDSIHQEYEFDVLWETPYVNGKVNGIIKGYYGNGVIGWEIPFVNGEVNGIQNQYQEDGSLFSTAKYKNGVLDGYKHCSDGRIGNKSLNCAL